MYGSAMYFPRRVLHLLSELANNLVIAFLELELRVLRLRFHMLVDILARIRLVSVQSIDLKMDGRQIPG